MKPMIIIKPVVSLDGQGPRLGERASERKSVCLVGLLSRVGSVGLAVPGGVNSRSF